MDRRALVALVQTGHECGELGAGEVPCERLGDLVVVVLEVVEGAGDCGGVVEVVGVQELALDDREVDLDLVEPAGVDRRVDEDQVRPAALEAVDGLWPRWSEPLSTIQNTRGAER